jgi:hypothetical protein
MNDCISDLEISASGGLVLVFSLFDSFSLRHSHEELKVLRGAVQVLIAAKVQATGDPDEHRAPRARCGSRRETLR